MPDLESSTPFESVKGHKFIRIGRRVVYNSFTDVVHDSIACQSGVNETGARNKYIVDDAGVLDVIGHKLVATDFSTGVLVRGDKNRARIDTNRIIGHITG